jgi:hypothetical protein
MIVRSRDARWYFSRSVRSALTLAAGSGQILAGLALILVDGIVGGRGCPPLSPAAAC